MKHENKDRTKQKRSPVLPREVNILFNGLFFFSFSNVTERPPYDRERCTVGILSTRRGANNDHSLFVRFGQPGHLSDPIKIPHSALSQFEEIEITRTNPQSARDVTIRGFDGPSGWGEPRNRNDRTLDPDFFNWIIDFEALHNRNLVETPGSLRPKLQFKTGDFYTVGVSEISYLKQQGEDVSPFGYAAAVIGAKIVLGDTDQIILTMNGVRNPLPMNITEIRLDNVRPKLMARIVQIEDKNHSSDGGSGHKQADHSREEHHDDSQIYYWDLLQGVPPLERFHFIPQVENGEKGERSEPFVCYGTGGSLP